MRPAAAFARWPLAPLIIHICKKPFFFLRDGRLLLRTARRDACGLGSRVPGFGVEAFRPFGFSMYLSIARRHVVRVFAQQ